MDRILILMGAAEYVDAKGAIESALHNAAHPEALSWGLTLQEYPDEEGLAALSGLRALFSPDPEAEPWTDMEQLWGGESYVLMANPAMRFAPGWDRGLLQALRRCTTGPVLTCALTGFLPAQDDPVGEVCPVAADEFLRDGRLSFRHGIPMRYADKPLRAPFLNPDFCFAPAGFFRAVAKGDEPLFMRAFRAGWELYTLHRPLIRMQWELPMEPVMIPADHDLQERFCEQYGVSFAGRVLSARARRGMKSEKYKLPEKFPLRLRLREGWRQFRHDASHLFRRHAQRIKPQCVTVYTADMPEETEMWLRQLSRLRHLPLTGYVPGLVKRQVYDFLPDAYELHPQHLMELRGQSTEALLPLSKAALLSAARDRILTPSHYLWIDADCVRCPVFDGAFLDWEAICTDKIVMAMVGGQPDTSIFCVPQGMVLGLATDLHARALTILEQRGSLPTETELWNLVLRENPDWFSLVVLPVQGQLFTQICHP